MRLRVRTRLRLAALREKAGAMAIAGAPARNGRLFDARDPMPAARRFLGRLPASSMLGGGWLETSAGGTSAGDLSVEGGISKN